MYLTQLLFERSFGPDARPLFASQSDLAKSIIEVEGKGELESTRAFVNQVIRGRRPPSDRFKDSIEKAVSERLSKRRLSAEDVEYVTRKLADAIDLGAIDPEKPLDDKKEFGALKEESERATVHFILTIRPAELRPNSTKAEHLKEDLAERLGLMGSQHTEPHKGKDAKKVRYIFNVPDELIARALWNSLHEYLTKERGLTDEESKTRLRALGDRLTVNVVTPVYCIPPMVVFDPDDDEGIRGFVLEYHKDDCVSVARLTSETLGLWKNQVYLPLTTAIKPKKHSVEQMTFDKYLEGEQE
jgi:hypothetical protein